VSQQNKPVLDEQTLDKLLEAAFVIQEQRDLQKQNPGMGNQLSTNKLPAAIAVSSAAEKTAPEKTVSKKSASEKLAVEKFPAAAGVSAEPVGSPSVGPASISKDAYTLTLAQIVETQQQILTRRLELENAMALVAQRAAEITRAAGSAIGIVEAQIDGNRTDTKKFDGKKLQYRAVSGLLTLARGSEVAMEKALCFNCLRSGEVIRGADVNSDFLLDAERVADRGADLSRQRNCGRAGTLFRQRQCLQRAGRAQRPVDGWPGDGSAGPRCRRLFAQVAGGGARHHAGSSGKTAAQPGGLDGESCAERIDCPERGARGNRADCSRSHVDAGRGKRFGGESSCECFCSETFCSESFCGQSFCERARGSRAEEGGGAGVFLPEVWPRTGRRGNVLRKMWFAAEQRISGADHAKQSGFALADATGEQAECCARRDECQRAAGGAENQSGCSGGNTALGSGLVGVGGPVRGSRAGSGAGTGRGLEPGVENATGRAAAEGSD